MRLVVDQGTCLLRACPVLLWCGLHGLTATCRFWWLQVHVPLPLSRTPPAMRAPVRSPPQAQCRRLPPGTTPAPRPQTAAPLWGWQAWRPASGLASPAGCWPVAAALATGQRCCCCCCRRRQAVGGSSDEGLCRRCDAAIRILVPMHAAVSGWALRWAHKRAGREPLALLQWLPGLKALLILSWFRLQHSGRRKGLPAPPSRQSSGGRRRRQPNAATCGQR